MYLKMNWIKHDIHIVLFKYLIPYLVTESKIEII
jgi:hypothetical protein